MRVWVARFVQTVPFRVALAIVCLAIHLRFVSAAFGWEDIVEVSNLHRQPLHWTPDVGRQKAENAAVMALAHSFRAGDPLALAHARDPRLASEKRAAPVRGFAAGGGIKRHR